MNTEPTLARNFAHSPIPPCTVRQRVYPNSRWFVFALESFPFCLLLVPSGPGICPPRLPEWLSVSPSPHLGPSWSCRGFFFFPLLVAPPSGVVHLGPYSMCSPGVLQPYTPSLPLPLSSSPHPQSYASPIFSQLNSGFFNLLFTMLCTMQPHMAAAERDETWGGYFASTFPKCCAHSPLST